MEVGTFTESVGRALGEIWFFESSSFTGMKKQSEDLRTTFKNREETLVDRTNL